MMLKKLHKNHQYSGPLFLVGMPRSGTKLLREILNRSQVVRIPRIETEFLPYINSHLNSFGDLGEKEAFAEFFSHITQYPFFTYLKRQGRIITLDDWYTQTRDYSTQGVFEALIRLVTEIDWDSAYIWGDKSPSYVNYLPLIKDLYPSARFIHIVRDVRDYSLSINKAWGKSMVRAAAKWGQSLQAVREFSEKNRESIFEIRYEDLISHPSQALEKIAQFIEIEYSQDMLRLDATTENLGDAKGKTGIVSGNAGKYRAALKKRQLKRIEEAAFNSMIYYGYSPDIAKEQRRPWRISMMFFQLLDAVNLVLSGRRDKSIWQAIRFHYMYKRATSIGRR